jgi:hypothetical protein
LFFIEEQEQNSIVVFQSYQGSKYMKQYWTHTSKKSVEKWQGQLNYNYQRNPIAEIVS